VTVALTGEGADELLGGYTFWYRSLFEMDEAASRHAAAVGAARVAGAICKRTGMTPPEWVGRLNRGALLARAYDDPGAAHAARSAQFSAAEIAALLPDSDVAWAALRPAACTLDEVLRSDLTTYLPGDILVKADRASMAHGLELRAPFLDWEFASFCVSLPIDLKVTAHTDKLLLRRAFADAWTPAVQSRGKQGFGAPVADWLQRPEVRALTHDVLDNPRSVVFDHVSKAAADRVRASGDAERTWPLLVLAVWCEQVAAKVRAPQFT
jgi:asparagine synthase (glutamine-hydrolysing)